MIGIISDTHENVAAIDKAVTMLRDLEPELVIHCGDIISPPVLEHFTGLPMRFIFGNNDGEQVGLRAKALELDFGEINQTLELELYGKQLLAYHGTYHRTLKEFIEEQRWDYILTGHTHQPRDERIERTRIINPGALFKAFKLTFATLDVENDAVKFYEVSR